MTTISYKMGEWTESEKKKLKTLYVKHGVKQAAKMLNRTYDATRKKVRELGYDKPGGTWTYDEKEYLKRMYPKYGPQKVADKLGRTYKSVQAKANKMNVYHWDPSRRFPTWTDGQLEFLINNFATMPNQSIANWIKKSPDAVRDTAYKLGLRKDKPHEWTDIEEEKLLKMIKTYNIDTISNSLKKPKATIKDKIKELEIKYDYFNDEKFRPSEVADILGVSAQTVRNYCAQVDRASDYDKFHGKKLYKMTIPQIVRFMFRKIDTWIDRDYDLSYIGILFMDEYTSIKYKKEINFIKSRIEESVGLVEWPKRAREKASDYYDVNITECCS